MLQHFGVNLQTDKNTSSLYYHYPLHKPTANTYFNTLKKTQMSTRFVMKGIYKKPQNSATKTIKATLQHLLFSFKYNTKITTDAHIINSPKKITNRNGKKNCHGEFSLLFMLSIYLK
jgi:tRNA(Ile2) C34 agmatinyltransferase TiaS